jgi:leucyl-tRNA synthetase
MRGKYNHIEIQKKWNDKWQAQKIYHPDMDNAKKPFYSLYMFPYPSAEGLHVGHAFSGTGADVYTRFKRMQGYDVFHPMGFDAFGIHSENFAIKINDHPQNLINRATKKFREQFDSLGFSYDWDHSVNTSSPEYYKWTQWLFIQLFKAGLVEKKKAKVNWCPSCKTVLADEQVLSGEKEGSRVCERCGNEVEWKELEQWFFKITEYADKLLEGLDRIDWTEKVKLAQHNWIGKSEGAKIKFKTEDGEAIDVFTTRPDTLFGATFLVLSPEHPYVKNNISKLHQNVKEYVQKALKKENSANKEKIGVFSGKYAYNPADNSKIPVWIADYVLIGYGTGSIMAVPAHDERDFEFAKKYELPIKFVLAKPEKANSDIECYTNRGKIIDSGEWTGWDSSSDFHKILDWIEARGIGERATTYHLRDWLISRQRYWGAPIPMVFCQKDGWQTVDETELPVLLPFVEEFRPLGTGVSPLASDEEFVNTICPVCKGPARRETDVADTFLDSSWYFLRYPSADFSHKAMDEKRTSVWLPVNMYIGGAEHSVLHLLYSRFITKVFHQLGMLTFDEPFTKFRAHGLIIKDGAKMSKSRGNVVNPDEYISKYGADTLRAYLMFLGPFEQGGDFRDSGIEGMERFLKRVRKLVEEYLASEKQLTGESAKNSKLLRLTNKTIKGVTDDIESLRYNTALAKIMELVNGLNDSKDNISKNDIKSLLLLLAPFTPYLAEELWEKLGEVKSIHISEWPSFDEGALIEEKVTIAVQVLGKLRDTILIANDIVGDQAKIEELALSSEKVKAHTDGKNIAKVIYVPGKIINFVVN